MPRWREHTNILSVTHKHTHSLTHSLLPSLSLSHAHSFPLSLTHTYIPTHILSNTHFSLSHTHAHTLHSALYPASHIYLLFIYVNINNPPVNKYSLSSKDYKYCFGKIIIIKKTRPHVCMIIYLYPPPKKKEIIIKTQNCTDGSFFLFCLLLFTGLSLIGGRRHALCSSVFLASALRPRDFGGRGCVGGGW